MAKVPVKGFLTPGEARHLTEEINSADPRRAQKALQQLCKRDRSGAILTQKDKAKLEGVVLGVLHKGTSDEPVRRWALNALGAIGSVAVSFQTVLDALERYALEPQVVSASIAAAYRLSPKKAGSLIEGKDLLDPKLVTLSALQTLKTGAVSLPDITIDLENDPELIQKLALVVVGLGKAPSRIFDPSYTNREIVRVLSRDGSPMVSQYAVWAISEHDQLGVSDLGFPINNLTDQPVNVQAYIHGIYASKGPQGSGLRYDIIKEGLDSDSDKIRLETAIGLRHAWDDGFDALVIDRFMRGAEDAVRDHLLDHMILQSERSDQYKIFALEFYELQQQDEILRNRMEAASSGLPIFQQFRSKNLTYREGFLPGFGEVSMVNIGSVYQHGNNSITGDPINHGHIGDQKIVSDPETAKQYARDALAVIETATVDDEKKESLRKALTEVQVNPSVGVVQKARDLLTQTQDALIKAGETGDALARLAGYAALFSALL